MFPFIFEHPIRTSICLPKRKSVVFCYALACTENTLQSANDKLSSAVRVNLRACLTNDLPYCNMRSIVIDSMLLACRSIILCCNYVA